MSLSVVIVFMRNKTYKKILNISGMSLLSALVATAMAASIGLSVSSLLSFDIRANRKADLNNTAEAIRNRIRGQMDCERTMSSWNSKTACTWDSATDPEVDKYMAIVDKEGTALVEANQSTKFGAMRLRAHCPEDTSGERWIEIEHQFDDPNGDPLEDPMTKRKMKWTKFFNVPLCSAVEYTPLLVDILFEKGDDRFNKCSLYADIEVLDSTGNIVSSAPLTIGGNRLSTYFVRRDCRYCTGWANCLANGCTKTTVADGFFLPKPACNTIRVHLRVVPPGIPGCVGSSWNSSDASQRGRNYFVRYIAPNKFEIKMDDNNDGHNNDLFFRMYVDPNLVNYTIENSGLQGSCP